jgi:type II secretory pathway component PulK
MTMTRTKRPARPGQPRKNEMGIAVLLVVACLAIVAPLTVSFNYQARVDWQSAVNVRDEVAARSIQRGAMSLSMLLFEIQSRVFNMGQFQQFMGTMDITQVAPYLMALFGTEDGADGLTGMGMMVGIDVSGLSDAFHELAIDTGSFEYRVSAESGKINVNCLYTQADPGAKENPAGRTVETLEALMAPALYDPLFEEEKSDGQFYTRHDIIRALADYIDDDRQQFDLILLRSGSGAENYRYGQLFDPYMARNGRLDSIDELHLVEGIDDDWMEAFGHELTVYGGCKVNLNFASAEQIALVIRHAATDDDRWKTEGENFLMKTMPLANWVIEQREYSLFKDVNDFKERIAKPDQAFNPMLMMGVNASEQRSLPIIPEGIAVWAQGKADPKDKSNHVKGLDDVAVVAPERTYRIEVITTVGAVKKRLDAVYDIQYPRSQSQGQGAWLYVREE